MLFVLSTAVSVNDATYLSVKTDVFEKAFFLFKNIFVRNTLSVNLNQSALNILR